jgi:hypothetical protein
LNCIWESSQEGPNASFICSFVLSALRQGDSTTMCCCRSESETSQMLRQVPYSMDQYGPASACPSTRGLGKPLILRPQIVRFAALLHANGMNCGVGTRKSRGEPAMIKHSMRPLLGMRARKGRPHSHARRDYQIQMEQTSLSLAFWQ